MLWFAFIILCFTAVSHACPPETHTWAWHTAVIALSTSTRHTHRGSMSFLSRHTIKSTQVCVCAVESSVPQQCCWMCVSSLYVCVWAVPAQFLSLVEHYGWSIALVQWEMSGLGLHIHTITAQLRNEALHGKYVCVCIDVCVWVDSS